MGFFNNLGMGVVLTAEDKMSANTRRAARSMDTLRNKSLRAGKDVTQQTDRMTAALSRYARAFTVGLKLIAGGAGLAAPAVLAVKAFADSERSLADIATLLTSIPGLTDEQIVSRVRRLADEIDRIALSTPIPLRELEDSSYKLVSGIGIDDAEKALGDVANLALATKGTMDQAAGVMVSMLKTFGRGMDKNLDTTQKANKISNILSGVVGRLKTDLPTLANAMKFAAPSANVLGIPLEVVATYVGMLQTMGLEGTTAGTAFAAMIRGMAQASRRMQDSLGDTTLTLAEFIKVSEGGTSGAASKLLKNNPLVGQLKLTKDDGSIVKLTDLLKQIADIFNIENPEDALKLEGMASLIQIFQDEGSRAISTLLTSADDLDELIQQVGLSNASLRSAGLIAETLTGKTIVLKNAFIILAKAVGEVMSEDAKKLVDWLREVAISMIEWVKINTDQTKTIVYVTLATAAFLVLAGAITLMTFSLKTGVEAFKIIGKQLKFLFKPITWLMNTLPLLRARLMLLAVGSRIAAAAALVFNAAMSANPIVLIILAIAGLITGIVLLVKNWDWLGAKVTSFFSALKVWVDDTPDWLLLIIAPMLLIWKHWGKITEALGVAWAAGKLFFEMVWGWIKKFGGQALWDAIGVVFSGIGTIFAPIIDGIKSLWTGLMDWITDTEIFKFISFIFDNLATVGKYALEALGFGDSYTNLLLGGPEGGTAAIDTSPGALFPTYSESVDRSEHRTNVNIFLPEDANLDADDVADATRNVLTPTGEN